MAHDDWRPPEPTPTQKRSAGSLAWRTLPAVVLPAIASGLAFPIFHAFTTVYNEPSNARGAFVFDLALILLPGAALALFVRNNWLFATGVALFVVVAVVVSFQIAKTDDAQAGLSALGLPVYLGVVVVILVAIDAGMRPRAGGAP